MALDEPEEDNPAAARHRAETAALIAEGIPEKAAQRRAGSRVFGSKPGAYGAGLQAMIDEKIWHDCADLANVYLDWGGHAYGGGVDGDAERSLFAKRPDRQRYVSGKRGSVRVDPGGGRVYKTKQR